VTQPLEYSDNSQWREVAWGGVRFEVPADWEIGEIGRRYLLFETVEGPRLEIKWGPVKGKFSPRAQFKKLAASQRRNLRKVLREDLLPAPWIRVLDRYESVGFLWHSGTIGGRGTVLYCPRCRQATLLQFYQTLPPRSLPYASRLLASFEDHTERSRTLWSVFDIWAKIPTDYLLKAFGFESGRYELSFTSRATTLTLQRWSPADALLGGTDLFGFEKNRLAYAANRSMVLKTRSSEAVEWEDGSHKDFRQRLRRRLRRQPLYSRARLWHEADKNRILGVRLEGRDPIDPRQLESICANYGTI
jgi:hypothetical protein